MVAAAVATGAQVDMLVIRKHAFFLAHLRVLKPIIDAVHLKQLP
jgi:hypothetical protein